jgi:predicted nucleic acid-binding protein
MNYLLDTNVWINVLRRLTASLAARFHALAPADIRICSVVVAELRHGCLRSAKPAANPCRTVAYRVLLTRARQGMVIYVPQEDSADATRSRRFTTRLIGISPKLGFQS